MEKELITAVLSLQNEVAELKAKVSELEADRVTANDYDKLVNQLEQHNEMLHTDWQQ